MTPSRLGRRVAAGACALLALVGAACASGPASTATTVAPPGCHTGAATVHVVLSDRSPVPVVRIPTGGCVAVTVPRSPFRHTPTGPTRTTPAGRLVPVSDSLLPNGTRVAYYTAARRGTATVVATVPLTTDQLVPQWSALVIIV
jgi:hypothetical protein